MKTDQWWSKGPPDFWTFVPPLVLGILWLVFIVWLFRTFWTFN